MSYFWKDRLVGDMEVGLKSDVYLCVVGICSSLFWEFVGFLNDVYWCFNC